MHRFLAVLFVASALPLIAQDLVIYGRVREHERPSPIGDAILGVSAEGVHHFDLRSDTTGFYRITLDVGKVWRIAYGAAGRVTKIVEYDLRNMPKDDGGYRVNVDIRLFREDLSKDFSFLNEPVGIFRYDKAADNLKVDAEYGEPRKARLTELMPEMYEHVMPDTISR